MSAPTLSVVVPCYNEQESIHACHEKLTEVLSALKESYEIVYVDDGSHDQTAALLEQIHARDSHVVVVRLSRNFGHQPAVTAGLSASLGQALVIIDADLQDPPELIPEMVALWRSGYKVVYGIRRTRDGETPFKLWTAKAFYRVINSLSDVDIPIDTGDFRLIDRVVVDVFLQMPERHRLLRGCGAGSGFRRLDCPISEHSGLQVRRSIRCARCLDWLWMESSVSRLCRCDWSQRLDFCRRARHS